MKYSQPMKCVKMTYITISSISRCFNPPITLSMFSGPFTPVVNVVKSKIFFVVLLRLERRMISQSYAIQQFNTMDELTLKP